MNFKNCFCKEVQNDTDKLVSVNRIIRRLKELGLKAYVSPVVAGPTALHDSMEIGKAQAVCAFLQILGEIDCPSCGRIVKNDEIYCPKCGTKVREQEVHYEDN